MRFKELFEADPKVKDKVKTEFDFDFADPDSKGGLSTSQQQSSVTPPGMNKKKRKPTKVRTNAKPNYDMPATGPMNLPDYDDISDEEALGNAGLSSEQQQRVATPTPTPNNLPAVISNAVREKPHAGQYNLSDWEPEWTKVAHLPGYIRTGIRQMGRQIFRNFTDTPLEDIQVMSTLVQPEHDVKKMMKWIQLNGIRDEKLEMDFENSIPGYKADVQLWRTKGYEFLLVKDFAGYYIYGWPGGRDVHLGNQTRTRRLQHYR